jgi:hypothetical protein
MPREGSPIAIPSGLGATDKLKHARLRLHLPPRKARRQLGSLQEQLVPLDAGGENDSRFAAESSQ